MSQISKEQVLAALRRVMEPELHQDLVSLKMIEDIQIDGGNVSFTIVLTTPACPLKAQIEAEATEAVMQIPGVTAVKITLDSHVPADSRLMGNLKLEIRNTIAVASGKGGVGKSTVSTNLALSLAMEGANVGLLDADIYGPNIPLMMGVDATPRAMDGKIIPPVGHGVKLISMGFLVDPKQPLIWRGPMLHGTIRQFLEDVKWGELDYLIIDLPPGTGDASLSLAQSMSLTGAVIVTTPQQVATTDVIRSIGMFRQLKVPILGLVENMSYFIAPDTGNRYDIFGTGGGKKMADENHLAFMGEIPIEIAVREGGDAGTPIVVRDRDSAAAQAIRKVARTVASLVSIYHLAPESVGQAPAAPTLNVVGQ